MGEGGHVDKGEDLQPQYSLPPYLSSVTEKATILFLETAANILST